MKKKYASLTVGCDATTTTIVDPFSSMVNYVDYDNTSSSTNNNDHDLITSSSIINSTSNNGDNSCNRPDATTVVKI